MGSKTVVVVWEVMSDIFSTWESYDPQQCAQIEKAYQDFLKTPQNASYNLHRSYTINFDNMDEQERPSMNVRPIHRLTFPLNSAFGKGVTWKWDSSGRRHRPVWLGYQADVVNYLEEEYSKNNATTLNLAKKFPDLDYTIDFVRKVQCNNQTSFERSVMRTQVQGLYPVSSASTYSSPFGLASNHTPSPSNDISNRPSTSSGNSGGDSSHGISNNHKAVVPPELIKYAKVVMNPPNEDCCICMASLQEESAFSDEQQGAHSIHSDVVALMKCDHSFHADCLKAAFKNDSGKGSLTCPYCKTIYGIKTGTQPPGSMSHRTMPTSLPGHPGCGTIQITYNFRSGIQTAEHPNPGKRFNANSFPRTAYLPDNAKGRKVLALLKIAWDRRLIFTIGQSVTTGMSNTVTWNEIHHKTEINNYSGHGYPDPNYLTNIIEELKNQGVTEDDLK